jgi:hemerythrin-like metal-binding protein
MNERKFFPWKPEYNLGIELIDNQHQQLTGIIDELFVSVQELKQIEQAKIVIQKLFDYTEFHFGMEEKYFEKFGWKESPLHKAEHKKFVNKILEFQKVVDKGLPATFQIIIFLKDWFANHVLVSDKQYVSFFKDKMDKVI